MKINKERIKNIIETFATYNDSPDNGISRFSYSETDCKAREYLIGLCTEIGLKVRVDSIGNIFARLEGSNPNLPIVMSGSHIDSVKNGGRYDGIVGVVGALEAIKVMVENNYKPQHSIDLVIFSEEEGSNFQVPVMGSKVLVGKLDIEDLKQIKNAKGEIAFDVIKRAGFNPDNITRDKINKGEIKAMVEMHIEQSVRLEMEGQTLGIVKGIAGLQWLKITLSGCSNHAGATPMHLRSDPMVAASQIIAEIKFMAKSTSNSTVATVGNIDVNPNIPNAIPGKVSFIVDIRDVNQNSIDGVVELIKMATAKYSKENNVDFDISKLASTDTIKIQQYLIDIMEKNAKSLNIDYILMPSGAVHDSNYMAEVTDVGMIFVPSKGGRSHVKEEFTSWEDIEAGTDLLLATLIELSK